MAHPDIALQDRLLPPLRRDTMLDLAPLANAARDADSALHTAAAHEALIQTVPEILRTGRTLRYIEVLLHNTDAAGWLVAHIKGDERLRAICAEAMSAGSALLASYHANELLDCDQPRIRAFGALIKQQAEEAGCLKLSRRTTGSWVDDIIERTRLG